MDHPVAEEHARLSCKQSGLAASHLLPNPLGNRRVHQARLSVAL